ncbi:MAG: hypothetical protein MUE60_09820 [Candidatus Eisenbacteria bacterium]|jgi:hypothetical protein|nr:hypothetical protein [Candidatus Eisenbacteria bacterium]
MSRAPFVALLAMLGFIALVALGLGWHPRTGGELWSRAPGRQGSAGHAPETPSLGDTMPGPLDLSATPPESLAASTPPEPLERPDSLTDSTATGLAETI